MRTLTLMGLLLVLPAAACSTTKVSTNEAPGTAQRAAAYRTYAWLQQPAKRDANHDPILEAQVQQSVDQALLAKGYQRVDLSAAPDFLVGWHAATQVRTRVEDINPYYGYGWGPLFGPPYGYGGAGAGVYVQQYLQGTLIVDVVDAASDKLVWRGSAQANLGSNPNGKGTQKKVEQATQKLLAKFPPRA